MAGSLVPRTNLGGYLAEIGQVYADQRDREEAAKLLGNQLDGLVQQPGAQTMPAPQSGLGAIGQQLGLYTPGQATPKVGGSPLPAFAQNGEIGRYAGAIQSNESGGNYGIVGPTHPKYGRALGAYQVMESNLPSWSQEALGRTVSPDEFLKNPQIQDAIFQKKFGQAVAKYGNPQDAASVWFTGRPLAQGANARDSLGTTGQRYVDKFTAALGRGAPAQTAQADMPAPGAQEAGYYIPGQQPPPAQQADFTPGSVASPAIGTGAAGSMPDAAGGQPRITPQYAQQLRAMLANPVTAPQAQAIIQKLQAPQKVEVKELGGRVVRVGDNGSIQAVPGFEKAPEYQTFTDAAGNTSVFNKSTGQINSAIRGKDTARRDLSVDEKVQRGLDPKAFAQIDSDGQVYFPNKAGTEINLNQAAEKAQDVKIGGAYGDTFNEMQTAGRSASGQINTLRLMEKLIENPDFYSGSQSGPLLAARRAAVALGIKDAGSAAPNELFAKLATQSVLDKLGGSLGAGVSNSDVLTMQNTVANATNTPEGNRQILQFSKALAQRQIEVAKLSRKYAGAHGGRLDAGFDDELAAYAQANPLTVPQTAVQQQQAARPQAPQAGGGQGPSAAQAAPAAPGAPSSPAIDLLRSDPRLRDQFDAKYGRGAADRALGVI